MNSVLNKVLYVTKALLSRFGAGRLFFVRFKEMPSSSFVKSLLEPFLEFYAFSMYLCTRLRKASTFQVRSINSVSVLRRDSLGRGLISFEVMRRCDLIILFIVRTHNHRIQLKNLDIL